MGRGGRRAVRAEACAVLQLSKERGADVLPSPPNMPEYKAFYVFEADSLVHAEFGFPYP
jgi:hypothetical protein